MSKIAQHPAQDTCGHPLLHVGSGDEIEPIRLDAADPFISPCPPWCT